MSGVKRYDISEFGGGMVEVEDGAWCHSDDYDSICNEWRVATGAVIMQRKGMAALRAQVEAMRKDAERYRWLRSYAYGHFHHGMMEDLFGKNDDVIDKEVDEAMQSKS